ncbi:MAG: hypothetical protein KC492_34735 [Myxococcales bacterium]|nr:hypothetical protein [Myxococcales bacterium]
MSASDYEGLPGAELLLKGLDDLRAGRGDTCEALLIATAAGKLKGLGVDVPTLAWQITEPELTMYALLKTSHPDPYAEYNALRRRFAKLERALEHSWSARQRAQEQAE